MIFNMDARFLKEAITERQPLQRISLILITSNLNPFANDTQIEIPQVVNVIPIVNRNRSSRQPFLNFSQNWEYGTWSFTELFNKDNEFKPRKKVFTSRKMSLVLGIGVRFNNSIVMQKSISSSTCTSELECS